MVAGGSKRELLWNALSWDGVSILTAAVNAVGDVGGRPEFGRLPLAGGFRSAVRINHNARVFRNLFLAWGPGVYYRCHYHRRWE